VTWRTRDDETTLSGIQYGAVDALDRSADAITYAYADGPDDVRIHEAHLCDLSPNTAYSYRVGSENSWSKTFQFRTAPADAKTQIEIAVLGDSRGGMDVLRRMAGEIRTHDPDLILFTGDAVTWGNQQGEWEDFFDSAEELFARAPVIATNGNHEGNAQNFYAQFAMPGDERNFSFSYGAAHITFLNDLPEGGDPAVREATPRLDAFLAAAAPDQWNLLVHHHSLWSASPRHGGNEKLRAIVLPVIDKNRVHLVLSGHDHNYERTLPLKNGEVTTLKDGTTYVVSGGAGADLYDSGTDYWTAFSKKTHSFLMLRASDASLQLRALSESSGPLDDVEILAADR